MTRVLGLDLGTTFLKGAVLDLETGGISDLHREPFPTALPGLPPRHVEIEPEAVMSSVRRLLERLKSAAPDVRSLFLSSQMHCLVLADDSARPLSNVISWKDQRTLEAHPSGRGSWFEILRELLTPSEVESIGAEVRVGVPIGTLLWLAGKARIPAQGRVHALSLPEFVLWRLTGEGPFSEPMHACASGLLDLSTGTWHRGLLQRLGLDALLWPPLRPTASPAGEARELGLVCHTALGDQQAALAGAGLQPGELSVNVSTGSQVSFVAPERRRLPCQVRPFAGGGWLHTIVQIPAGRALAVLAQLVGEVAGSDVDPWDAIERAVGRTGETDLEVDLAFYAGAMGERGAISNIREDNLTVGTLFAAAFKAMARNYALCARRLLPSLEGRTVVFSGGLAQRFERLRVEIIRELGGLPHRVCLTPEDALLGLLQTARAQRLGR